EPNEDKPERECRRARDITLAEPQPQPREDRSERDDERRLRRLQPARRVLDAEEVVVRIALREQVAGPAGLAESGPEDRRRDEEDEDHDEASALVRRPVAEEE